MLLGSQATALTPRALNDTQGQSQMHKLYVHTEISFVCIAFDSARRPELLSPNINLSCPSNHYLKARTFKACG